MCTRFLGKGSISPPLSPDGDISPKEGRQECRPRDTGHGFLALPLRERVARQRRVGGRTYVCPEKLYTYPLRILCRKLRARTGINAGELS